MTRHMILSDDVEQKPSQRHWASHDDNSNNLNNFTQPIKHLAASLQAFLMLKLHLRFDLIFFFVRSSVVFCPSISFAEIIVKHNTPKQNRKVTYFALRTFVAEFIIKRGTSEKDRNRALLLYEFCFAEFIVKRGTPEENRKVGDFALRIFFC
jgi:hypothetical protein